MRLYSALKRIQDSRVIRTLSSNRNTRTSDEEEKAPPALGAPPGAGAQNACLVDGGRPPAGLPCHCEHTAPGARQRPSCRRRAADSSGPRGHCRGAGTTGGSCRVVPSLRH